MRWRESLTGIGVAWVTAVVLFWLFVGEMGIGGLLYWSVAVIALGFLVGFGWQRYPGLPWLALVSVALAYGIVVLVDQPWNWTECAHGEYGESCQWEKAGVWLAGMLAAVVMAAVAGGMVVSRRRLKRSLG